MSVCWEFVIRTTVTDGTSFARGEKVQSGAAINIGEHKDPLSEDAPCTCANARGVSTKNAELLSPRLATYSKVSLSVAGLKNGHIVREGLISS
ncbi:hypothetical protein CDAR_605791 [Caerostris darwini]|uniref:Uncharacterized protein n=1 Tax=Caerostris darwini TaxID=1538125 RepID=A0AAV4UA44_9ARAC|nr:hypothetical protein CDAR_605791 [Caerostris darwini]